jgi:hypothetical protein
METVVDDVQELSKELLKGLTLRDGEKAVFKLCAVGKREYGREEPSSPEIYKLTGKENIFDPFDKRKKTFASSLEENRLVGNRMVAIYERPEFVRGYCTVTSDNPGMYIRLMRSKNCVSNKFRRKMGKCRDLFELVEDTKEINDQLQIADLRWQAETIVRTEEFTELRSICTKLKESPDQRLHVKSYIPGQPENYHAIKLELINIAKLYPKQLISASGNQKAILQVQIFDALNFNVLVFENGSYNMFDIKDKYVELFKPEIGKDKLTSLIEYLMSDVGRDSYGHLMAALQKTLKAA